ncbi:MAG: serine/threonine protein kinase [Myxococcota bacterium]
MKRRNTKDFKAAPESPAEPGAVAASGGDDAADLPSIIVEMDDDDDDDEDATAAFVLPDDAFSKLPKADATPFEDEDDDDDDDATAAFMLPDDAFPKLPIKDAAEEIAAAADGDAEISLTDDTLQDITAEALGIDIRAPHPVFAEEDEDEEDDEEATAAFILPDDAYAKKPADTPAADQSVFDDEDDDDDDDDATAAFILPDDAYGKKPAVPPVEAHSVSSDDGDKPLGVDPVVPVVSPLELALADSDEEEADAASEPAAAVDEDEDEDEDDRTMVFAGDVDEKPAAAASTPAAAAFSAMADSESAMKSAAEAAAAAPAPDVKDDDGYTGMTGGTGVTGVTGSSLSAWTDGATTSGTLAAVNPEGKTKPGPGVTIAQYELIRLLGEGGMGAVYLGRDIRLGRRVAIKFLHTASAEMTERFVIEAQATARVEHENIVSIYEVGMWGDSPYMVLQFLQGNELSKLIPRGKAMPVPRVVELMTPVLRALDCAHKENIVHRDLKPDNIFITDGGVTKVLDFGIAKVVQGDDAAEAAPTTEDMEAAAKKPGLTGQGTIVGTMPYMSPEQWGNGIPVDHTTDIWAVGIMMYKMLSGRHPLYPLKGTELMCTGFIDEPMPSLREKAPDLPEELIAVIDKCLSKEKHKRYADAKSMIRALEPFQPGRYTVGKAINVEESPYAGLSSFQEEDAGRFFGRNREIAAMSQRLRDQPIMAVVGPSGVGKSSFLRAGVVPALKASGESWDISVVRPGRNPMMALAGLISQITDGSGDATSMNIGDEVEEQKKRAERLRNEPGYLGTVLRRHARRQNKKILIFVDQFEELYTLVDDLDERLALTACLSAVADDPTSPMRVVVSIRSDFLDRCTEDIHFMNEISQGLFFITAPTVDGMRDSLVLPAQMAGYKFESDEIVKDMLDHLSSTSGALPLLQFTADKLWGERDPVRKMLTRASYDALGGVGGALASHADQVLKQIPGDQRKMARALFLRLVTPDRTRAIVPMDDLRDNLGGATADSQRIIDQMVAARLLVVQTGGAGGGATVEIVHESLIHGWPQLRRWLDEGQEDAAFLEQLRTAARQWKSKNKDSGLLWRGETAEEAKRFVRRFRGELPQLQQQFLKAVIDQTQRAARVRRALLITAAVVAVVLLAAAAVALYVINGAAEETEKQAVAARASEVRATDAARIAESRKAEAEEATTAAQDALQQAKASSKAKEEARAAEQKALKEANLSRAQLADALVDAKEAERRAVDLAAEAKAAKGQAEQEARAANIARQAATAAAANLQVALRQVEAQRKQADAARRTAEEKVKKLTKGGLAEELQ